MPDEQKLTNNLVQLLATASPPVRGVLRFFAFSHLPPHLKPMSMKFAMLACDVASESSNAETTLALRKLLEAKDAAVRALLPDDLADRPSGELFGLKLEPLPSPFPS
jgi:hypothetical protein